MKEKEKFLKKNQNIVGKDQGVKPIEYKELSEYYSGQIKDIMSGFLKKKRQINKIEKELTLYESQIENLKSNEKLPSGEIKITVSSKKSFATKLEISYFVNNAGWFPSYDFRVEDINKPIKITYKANIKQNTGIEWSEVKLKLSNANPSLKGNLVNLKPYYLSYQTVNYGYLNDKVSIESSLSGRIAGLGVSSSSGSGAYLYDSISPGGSSNIRIRGLGSLKGNNKPLYVVDGVPISGDIGYLDRNEITSMNILKYVSATALYGSRASNGVVIISTKKGKQKGEIISSKIGKIKRKASVEYDLNTPYTIKSNGELELIEMKRQNVNALYKYKSIPKMEDDAFLVAQIPDWENLNLLSGDINLYYENTYVGKSLLSTNSVSDTLNISIGRDKNIVIKKEKQRDFNSRQFIGNKQFVTRSWIIKIRNTKETDIKLDVYDQIPISTNKEIQVANLEISNGKFNKLTGELKWTLNLKSKETKELIIRYQVKYSKDKQLKVE